MELAYKTAGGSVSNNAAISWGTADWQGASSITAWEPPNGLGGKWWLVTVTVGYLGAAGTFNVLVNGLTVSGDVPVVNGGVSTWSGMVFLNTSETLEVRNTSGAGRTTLTSGCTLRIGLPHPDPWN